MESKNTSIRQLIRSIVVSILLLSGCVSNTKFNKEQWHIRDDMGGTPYRDKMANDLLQSHKTIGLKYSELIDLLGSPESVNKDTIYYETFLHWDMIDPNYIEGVEFIINKDSIIIANRTTKWQKDTSMPYWINSFDIVIIFCLIVIVLAFIILGAAIKYIKARFNRYR